MSPFFEVGALKKRMLISNMTPAPSHDTIFNDRTEQSDGVPRQ